MTELALLSAPSESSPSQSSPTDSTDEAILVGSADAVSGTQRPYDYFRWHFDRGAPWTFVVQNQVPHCCIMNAKALTLEWLDAVVVRRLTRSTGRYGFILIEPTDARGCPGQTAPVRTSLCLGSQETWGGQNWSVSSAAVEKRPIAPKGMMPAGWLPTDTFGQHWKSFITQPRASRDDASLILLCHFA